MTSSRIPTSTAYNRLFRRLTLFTVITVYLLIIAGGVVRSTGAGMGCPDWPKCFGSWIPPTEVSQLPLNYKDIYGAKLKGEVEFNAVKTWIEYINRLLGAFTGLLIFVLLLASIPLLRSGKSDVFYASLSAFILVGFQGWLGSKVVSTELHPLMVTLHMVVAIVIVFVLLFILTRVFTKDVKVSSPVPAFLKRLLVVVIGLSFVQVVLGTQVREAIDVVITRLGYTSRDQWIQELGLAFYVHRSFSILVLLANAYLLYRINTAFSRSSILYKLAIWVMILIGAEILTGIIMAYFAVPAFAQPIHLTLAILLLGVQFVMWLSVSLDEEPAGKRADAIEVFS